MRLTSHSLVLLFLITAIASIPAPVTAQQSKPVVTPEALLSFQSDSVPGAVAAWIPGTNAVILPVNEPPMGDTSGKPKSDWIERIDTVTGQRNQLVQGTQPILSPDGKQIAYLSKQSGTSQVWLTDVDGANARQVTHSDGGFNGSNLSWSPDSSQLAYTTGHPEPDQAADVTPDPKVKSSVVVYGQGKKFLDDYDPPSDIWTLSTTDGSAKKIATVPGRVLSTAWAPNGNLFVTVDQTLDSAVESLSSAQVMVVHMRTEAVTPIGDPLRSTTAGNELSPDGKWVAATWTEYHGGYWNCNQIAVITADSGAVRVLPTPFKTSPLGWSPDGKHLFIWKRNGAYDQILQMSIDGKLSDVGINCPFQFVYTGNPAFANDGRMAWIDKDPKARVQLVTASIQNPLPHVVCDFSSCADQFSMADYEPVYWTNKAGVSCGGLLIKPVGYQPGKKYPLLTVIHGGPGGGIDLFISDPGDSSYEAWALEAQMWAGKGYAVFYPEYQSSGRQGDNGIAYMMREHQTHDMFSGDLDDITSGVQHLVNVGLADSKKLALVGHSAGAIETYWIITHSHLFQAAIAYEGTGDWYANQWNDHGVATKGFDVWMLGGSPVTAPDAYIKNSAIYHVKGVTTPTLFINGNYDDGAIDSQSASRMYVGLREQGIDTQYIRYPDEGHVATKPENVRNVLYWYINWVDTHLGFPPTPDPTGDFNVADLETTTKPSQTADSDSESAASLMQPAQKPYKPYNAH